MVIPMEPDIFFFHAKKKSKNQKKNQTYFF